MSAYALPGFFPPIEGFSLYSKEEKVEESTGSSGSSEDNDCSNNVSSSCSNEKHSSQSVPLHEASSKGYANNRKRSTSNSSFYVLGDAVKASVGKLSYMLTSSENITPSDSPDCPGIAVKEAKIDPVRLVQCVTSSPHRKQGKTLRKRGSRERLTDGTSSKKNLGDKNGNNSHDEAIEFELSISFNGRKYTATRTLQCIVQLRNDLIREMSARKQWLQQCRAGATVSPFQAARVPFTSSRSTPPSYGAYHSKEKHDDADSSDDFEIPEIPPLSGEHDDRRGNSFVGRGFSMLHAMATSYVPVMEWWLRTILAIVPQDSESLVNFLWEPSNDMPSLEATFPSSPSMSGLDSIRELDYNTGDDGSDDEWEG